MSVETFQGEPIVPGFAEGSLQVLKGGIRITPALRETEDPPSEIARFRQQLQQLEQEIEAAVDRLESDAFRSEAEIMRTHLAMLRDPELHHQVIELIENARHQAETAVEQVLQGMSAMLATAEDPHLAERAVDLRDLASRLAEGFEPRQTLDAGFSGRRMDDVIIAMPELMPSVVLEARERGVAGFVVERGTSVSHGAILARSFGMPAVRITRLETLAGFAGRRVLVWGGGEVLVEPGEAEVAERRPSENVIPIEREAGAPRVRVWVSIVDPAQLKAVDWTDDVQGVGLYRSEALFLRFRDSFPTEQEQYAVYRKLFMLAGQRPVVFRTVDLGADKPLEHMSFGPQDNPCLGLRAHRLFRFHPEILITQLRAVLRAADGEHQLRLMFPMIESIDQLHFVRHLLVQAVRSLDDDGLCYQKNFTLGVLIETPSAVWSFRRLIEEVDFASVGTNDLVQYLFAVERNAANVADLYQPEHPVVLQIIQQLAEQAAEVDKPLSICGEIAADVSLLPALVGLGVGDISVAPNDAASLRRYLHTLSASDCRNLAQQCLKAATLGEVRKLLGRSPAQAAFNQSVGEGEAVDPVCGMVVQTGNTPYVVRIGGVAHYFCSRSCLNHFVNRPKGEGSKA